MLIFQTLLVNIFVHNTTQGQTILWPGWVVMCHKKWVSLDSPKSPKPAPMFEELAQLLVNVWSHHLQPSVNREDSIGRPNDNALSDGGIPE